MSDDAPVFDAPTTRPQSRKKQAAKWGLVLLVGAGALVAATPFLLSTSWMNGVVRSWLKDNVDRDVEFASLDVSWSEGVRLSGLVVHDEVAGQPPMLEAPLVVLRAPILPLLARRLEVEEFVIQDPVVRVSRRGESSSAHGVVRLRKPKRSRPAPKEEEPGAAEPMVLPEIDVPVQVRNLTLVLADEQGREARRPGITFAGRLVTRDGPTTFDLKVPTGDGEITMKGAAALFDPDGVLLPQDQVRVDADVVVRNVDAKANGDLLALFLPGRPVAGAVDAKAKAFYDGKRASGSLDLHVRGVAVDDAVGRRSAMQGDDLAASATWAWDAGRIDVKDLKVRAEGLAVDGNVAGTLEALDGRVTLDADLARMTAALRTFGVPMSASLEGRAKGDVTFTPSPSRGTGTLTLTGFRAAGVVEGKPPVALDRADVRFVAAPSADAFRIESLDVALGDLTAHASGSFAKDGALDLRTDAKGDLGGLLARVRDLGLLPADLSIAGTLDAAVAVKGRPDGTGADALSIAVERLALVTPEARIEARGTASLDGDVDLTATGSGDLASLLGRAQAAGVQGPGLDALRGKFEFDAAAKGPAKSVVVTLSRFRLDGDFGVEASGEFRRRADDAVGDLTATLRASGRIADALLLARKIGAFDRDLPLDGTLQLDASVGGTVKAPVVPKFTLEVASDVANVAVTGAVAADRRVQATAKGTAEVGRARDLLMKAGFATDLPPARGRLTFDADVAGSTEEIAVPRAVASLRGGPADLDVTGELTAAGRVSGNVTMDGALADLAAWARDAGWITKPIAPQGRVSLRAEVGGTRNRVHVPSAELRVTGLADVTVRGSYDAGEYVKASAEFRGAAQPLLDLAAQWTGGTARRVDGTFEGALTADGPRDRVNVALTRFTARAGGLQADAGGARDAQGDVVAKATLRGPIPDLLNVLRAFGVANDVHGTGNLDVTVDGTLRGDRATANVTAAVVDLLLAQPAIGSGGPFREPRAVVTATNVAYDLKSGRLDPVRLLVQMDGAQVDATADVAEGPPNRDFTTTRVVNATGQLTVEERFVRNHPELFPDTTLRRAEGPFRFRGDVSQGRAGAAEWTGGAELVVEGLTAPHVAVERARVTAKLEGGNLLLDPITGAVNGGTVNGKARIGLVGERPEHTFELTGKDVQLDAELAPLVARASPLFAIGENGKTGGKANVDLKLTGRGLDSEVLKRTLTGSGTVGFRDAFVESGGWVGALMSIVGSSGRMDIAPVDVPFQVAEGRVKTGDVAMDGVGLLLRLGGEVALDGKLDYALRLKPKSAGGAFEKYASFLDADGFLPLRLEGKLSNPKLKAPDVKDVLKGKLDGLLDGLLGGRDKKDEPPKDPPPKQGGGKKKKQKKDGTGEEPDTGTGGAGADEPPPPPPPPPRNDDPPPPPPPSR